MKAMKKIGAAALALAMLGTGMSSIAFADEAEETYDFGGVTVKVFGNQWNNLNPEATNDVTVQLEAKDYVEKKYNVVLEYSDATANGWDGYNMGEVVQTTMSAGGTFANIIDVGPEGLAGMMVGGILSEITDDIDQLEVGSLYTDAVTWGGKCYGMTFDNIGDTYALVYSRDYLEEIGMDETPTDKFIAGEWSYDDMREYLTEMKSKLPEGVYPMGVHFFHWQTMAGAANGAVAVSSEGKINITNEDYLESLTFYKDLMADGLAYPVTYEFDEDGNPVSADNPIGISNMGTKIVITRVESWEFGGIEGSVGQWGLVMWPWGDNVTCEGDYTTLSDNYHTAQSYWGSCLIPADATEQTGIEPIDLMLIAQDYYDYISPSGAEGRHSAWEAEQAGEQPAIGFEAGTARNFCTVEDMELYDWAHTRVIFDWSKPLDDAGICDIWGMSREIICYGNDARSTAESYYQEALALAEEMGLILADAEEEVEVETEESTEE